MYVHLQKLFHEDVLNCSLVLLLIISVILMMVEVMLLADGIQNMVLSSAKYSLITVHVLTVVEAVPTQLKDAHEQLNEPRDEGEDNGVRGVILDR